MAKKHRKKEDNFLRNVLIIFGSVFVILMGVMIYYNITALDYDDFEQLGEYSEVAIQDEDLYAVYYYSTSCGACASIKEEILKFAKENELGMKLYLLGYEVTARDNVARALIVGPNDETLSSFPTLMIYQDGEMIEFLVNTTNITAFMDDVASGDYTVE